MNTNRQPGIAWLQVLIALVAGIALGLLYGWVISPVQWIDADPSFLRADLQQEWVRMTADSLRVNGNVEVARQRLAALGDKANPAFSAVVGSLDPALAPSLQAVLPPPSAAAAGGNNTRSLANIIATFCGALGLLAILGYGLYRLLGNRQVMPRIATEGAAANSGSASSTGDYRPAEPFSPADTMGNQPDDDFYSDNTELPAAAASSAATGGTRAVTSGYTSPSAPAKTIDSTPIIQFTTTYMLGDDLYDESFSIDDSNGDFLGECGVGIGETIGVGEPKKVTAFEVWLFDKNDIRTVTKVLMSNHAYQDDNVRAKLSAKGEPVLLEPGKTVYLETATLNVSARVVDLQYGGGSLPNQSYLSQLIVELIAYKKI